MNRQSIRNCGNFWQVDEIVQFFEAIKVGKGSDPLPIRKADHIAQTIPQKKRNPADSDTSWHTPRWFCGLDFKGGEHPSGWHDQIKWRGEPIGTAPNVRNRTSTDPVWWTGNVGGPPELEVTLINDTCGSDLRSFTTLAYANSSYSSVLRLPSK